MTRCQTMGTQCRCAKVVTRKTGAVPVLAQDDCRGLFRWFAERLGSRREVRRPLVKEKE